MSKLINIALKEVGYSEIGNSNKTKYGKWFGLDGVAWCGIFVSWCYAKAGTPLPKIGFTKGFAGCQTLYAYAVKNNLIIPPDKAQPGDIVLFDWQKDGRYDHVGLFVERVDNKTFKTVEGNTSLKNQSNGGSVMERVRKYSVATFIRPKI